VRWIRRILDPDSLPGRMEARAAGVGPLEARGAGVGPLEARGAGVGPVALSDMVETRDAVREVLTD
jgi:hypothetical protein